MKNYLKYSKYDQTPIFSNSKIINDLAAKSLMWNYFKITVQSISEYDWTCKKQAVSIVRSGHFFIYTAGYFEYFQFITNHQLVAVWFLLQLSSETYSSYEHISLLPAKATVMPIAAKISAMLTRNRVVEIMPNMPESILTGSA